MGDLPYIQQRQEVSVTGQDSTGDQINYVSADANGNMFTKDYSNGTPGSAAPVSAIQIAGSDGTNLRVVATDSVGRVKIAASSYFHPVFSARVQSTTAATTVLGTTVTATFTSPTKAGNTIIVAAVVNAGTLTITDSASQVYSTATTIAGNGTQTSKIFYFPNTAAGVTTVTISSTSSTDLNLVAVEYTGVLTASPLDQTSTHGQTAATTWTSNSTTTTAQASELLIGSVMVTLHNNDTLTPATAWSSVSTVNNTRGGSNIGVNMSDQNVVATGTYAFTGTMTGNANDDMYAAVATFKFATPSMNVALNTPVTIKSGSGILRKVAVNTVGTGLASVTFYDSTTSSGTVIGALSLVSAIGSMDYNLNFANGLTMVINSSTADFTVVYE